MSTPEPSVGFSSMKESFRCLRALWDYARINKNDESSMYGALSFIITLYCTSASVAASKSSNFYLGSFPQKALKPFGIQREFRAPDFTVLVVQSGISHQLINDRIGNMSPLIWEAKASFSDLTWFGEERSQSLNAGDLFLRHFHQIAAQVAFAKASFHQKPIYAVLSVDIWFTLLYFPENPPSVIWTGKNCKPLLRPEDYLNFFDYIKVLPTPMVNNDCTAFSPEFLYALQLSVTNLSDVTVTPHPSFLPPEGTAELVAAQLKERWFIAKFEEEARRAEIEGKFALGEEESDERSARWSTAEETETDLENQKHPTAAPAVPDHLLTSPAKTRSKAMASKVRVAANTSAQAKKSNMADSSKAKATATASKEAPMTQPQSSGKTRCRRPRRKAAENTPGYRKESIGSD